MTPDPTHHPAETATNPILDGVRTVLRTHLAFAGPVEPATDLTEELQLDSLGQLTLVVELENHFRICIESGDEESLQTVGDLMGVIEKQLGRNGNSHV